MKNISIIIVSLNTRQDFIKTIQSVTNQNYIDCEIIVVDGYSNDGTIDEIKKKKQHISKVIIEKDKGIYDAMNKGISICESKWTIFLNSGDIFFNDNILKSIDFKNLYNYDIVYGDTCVEVKDFKYRIKSGKIKQPFALMPFCHQSVFVKTAILKKNQFSLDYKISSDFDLFQKCYHQKKLFFYINSCISIIKPGGISDTKRQIVYDENIKILKKNKLNYLIFKLRLIKIINIFKNILKSLLGKKLTSFCLRIKYFRKEIK